MSGKATIRSWRHNRDKPSFCYNLVRFSLLSIYFCSSLLPSPIICPPSSLFLQGFILCHQHVIEVLVLVRFFFRLVLPCSTAPPHF